MCNRLVGASAVLISSSRQPPRPAAIALFAPRRGGGGGTPSSCLLSRHYNGYYSSVFPSSSYAAETTSLQGGTFINLRYFQSFSTRWDTQQQHQQQQLRGKSGVAQDSTPPDEDDDDDSSSPPPVPVSREGEADITTPQEDVAAVPTTTVVVAAKEEDDSSCPPWQNPLHHDNPDYQGGKILAEDYELGEEMPLIPLPPFESCGVDGSSSVLASPHIHELANDIVHLSMLEVKELVDRVGEHFGIGDDEDDFGGGGGGGGGGGEAVAAPVVEAKTVFDLRLTGFDEKSKIKVIKEIRTVTSLGLKEAKELVEGAPTYVKKAIKMEEAEELKTKLEAAGATVEIV